MPTMIHECFVGRVELEFGTQLQVVAGRNDCTGLFARGIKPSGSGDIFLQPHEGPAPDIISKHEPDASSLPMMMPNIQV
jgi:hypothetical protein